MKRLMIVFDDKICNTTKGETDENEKSIVENIVEYCNTLIKDINEYSWKVLDIYTIYILLSNSEAELITNKINSKYEDYILTIKTISIFEPIENHRISA